MGRLDGRVALVTGAGGGIGRAAAVAMADEGARIVATDVDTRLGEETAKATGGRFVAADVTRGADVDALLAGVRAHEGRLDVAFNNAGIEGEIARIVETPEADFDRVIAVNLKGVWLCMRAEVPLMLSSGGGSIVNTASVAGLNGWMGATAYSASKHGVVGLTRTVALEYARKGIRANCVCPGVIETPMFTRMTEGRPKLVDAYASRDPMGRIGQPDEVAKLVAWLASDESAYVNGAAIPVDGGWTAQ